MDTQSLKLFVLAAEKRNISAAGRVLGMGPAVASARLAKLERALATELLHRTTRRVSLSLEGEAFLPYAREMLAQEQAALAALGQGSAEATGTLRFAAPSTFAQLYIAPLLPVFLGRHPGVSLDLRLSDTMFNLVDGSFDLALRSGPRADTSLKGRKLADDPRILCASPAYLKRRGAPRTPDELAGHDLVGFANTSARRLINSDGAEAHFDLKKSGCRLVMDDGASQVAATVAGAGISMNGLWSVHEALTDGTLVHVLPDWRIDDGSILWLVYPKSNVLTAKVRVFIDFLVEHIGRDPAWLRK